MWKRVVVTYVTGGRRIFMNQRTEKLERVKRTVRDPQDEDGGRDKLKIYHVMRYTSRTLGKRKIKYRKETY